MELDDNQYLMNENFFEKELYIKISKSCNDLIFIKYPNLEVKIIKTDLYNTVLELIEEVQNENMNQNKVIYYNLFFNNKKISFDELLFNLGINKGDLIELKKRETFDIFIKSFSGKLITRKVESSDKIKYLKYMIQLKEGVLIDNHRLIYLGRELDENRTFADYNIQNESTIHLIGRLLGGKN